MGRFRRTRTRRFRRWTSSLRQMVEIVAADPAVDTVIGFTGGGVHGQHGPAVHLAQAARRAEDRRPISIIARLRPKLATVPGATMYLQAVAGRPRRRPAEQRAVSVHDAGRQSGTISRRSRRSMVDRAAARSDRHRRQQRPAESRAAGAIHYDRETAARFGISPQLIDATLYDASASGRSRRCTRALNQYHVVMEAAPEYLAESAVSAPILRAAHPSGAGGAAQRLRARTRRRRRRWR